MLQVFSTHRYVDDCGTDACYLYQTNNFLEFNFILKTNGFCESFRSYCKLTETHH